MKPRVVRRASFEVAHFLHYFYAACRVGSIKSDDDSPHEVCDSVTTAIDIVRFAQIKTLSNPYLLRINVVCKLQHTFKRQFFFFL